MLPDGTAMAVYTLDKSGTGDTTTYEVGYTMVSPDGTLGSAMLVTSDSYLDENPQVVTANFGTADGSDRFVLAWHSLRDGLSDIQLLAVDSAGVMSNSFPASSPRSPWMEAPPWAAPSAWQRSPAAIATSPTSRFFGARPWTTTTAS